MAIVKTISAWNFREEFIAYGRGDSFSYQGFKTLYDYLTDLSDDLGEPLELDPVSIDCDFYEYTLEDLKSEYRYLLDSDDVFESDNIDSWIELLSEYTTVLVVNDYTVIVQVF